MCWSYTVIEVYLDYNKGPVDQLLKSLLACELTLLTREKTLEKIPVVAGYQ